MKKEKVNIKIETGDFCRLIEDEFENQGIILSKYEAGNIKALLKVLEFLKMPVNTGDWFNFFQYSIPDWSSNVKVSDWIKMCQRWLDNYLFQEKQKWQEEFLLPKCASCNKEIVSIHPVFCIPCAVREKNKLKKKLAEKIGELKVGEFLGANPRNKNYDEGFNQAIDEILKLLK